MAPVTTASASNAAATKVKRPVPPGIQTNGVPKQSPSPSLSSKKPPLSAKQPPTSASDRTITASTVRPVNRNRRESSQQTAGRNAKLNGGLRSGLLFPGMNNRESDPRPYVITDEYILKKYRGHPPSLVIHLHASNWRFDGQDGMFQYKSPMRVFLEHLRAHTLPHDLLDEFIRSSVPFYDGCLIVQVHDHKSAAQSKDVSKAPSTSSAVVPSSVHNYNQCLTPSPFVPFPKDDAHGGGSNGKVMEDSKDKVEDEKDKENLPAPNSSSEPPKSKTATKPRIITTVMHPTAESFQVDLYIKMTATQGSGDGNGAPDGTGIPPSTPLTGLPPTPSAGTMLPPAKRQKKEKTELDGSNVRAFEGQVLLATNAPLMLEPTKSVEETILLLEALSHPKHSEPPPQPKTRKRTVAEMAADEAAAAEQERYMLHMDERLSSSATGAQGAAGADGDGPTGAATFEPRFERFKAIADIKREHAEKKEQEKIKQQENDRRMQQQRQQDQALALQRQQEAEKAKREAQALRETQMRQAEAQRQAIQARAAAAAAAAASTPTNQGNGTPTAEHAQRVPHGRGSMGAPSSMPMAAQPQPRFPAQLSQPPASSPVRQGTPQNMSSPMVGSAPMQQTNSNTAASPPRRPSSIVQNGPMSVPMSHDMAARGSQQSHPSGTPRIPHSTPNMAHGTPVNRPNMVATPRMTQASPPPAMMAQNSQMGAGMMMNQGMAQHNPQVIAQLQAQQRHLAQQQHLAAMGGGNMNNGLNGQGQGQGQGQGLSVQQMTQLLQRQILMQQQNGVVNPQLNQQLAQLQALQSSQARQMPPQMQQQLQQQMARQMAQMGQMGGQGNNPMQRQMSGQMMNGNNINMQALAAMQMQQQQQQMLQQQQQQQQQQQMQMNGQMPQQQMNGNNVLQQQVQEQAKLLLGRMLQAQGQKFGAVENIPPDYLQKLKQTAYAQAQQLVNNSIAQRRAQQQQQQQLMLQQQQQQQAAMQGMGGMMGPL